MELSHALSPKSSFELAAHQATHSVLKHLTVSDVFEVLDILQSISTFQNPPDNFSGGMDVIRWLDRCRDKNVSLCFLEKEVYCVLLKFTNQEEGGLLLTMSTDVQVLINLFSQMQTTDWQQQVLLWLIDN